MRKGFTTTASPVLFAIAIAGLIAAAVEVDDAGSECNAGDRSCGALYPSAGPGPDTVAGDDDASSAGGRKARRAVCQDKEPECEGWASMGECENNPNYMLIYCPISCDSCPDAVQLSREEEKLLDAVEKYGEPQKVEGDGVLKTMEVIRKTVAYMENDVYGSAPTHSLSEEILAECVNREELCAFWAAIGECEANKSYMKTKCAPSCQTCEMIDMRERCPPLGEDARPGLLPGGLNAMFERIVKTAPGNRTYKGDGKIEEGMTNYTVHILSRPGPFDGERTISEVRDREQPPWVLTFENFLTSEECKHLIEMGHKSNFERSKDVGEVQADGSYDSLESKGRTSENAWCSFRDGCRSDVIVQRIHSRIEKVTSIPQNHSEDFQLLRYEPGQFYRVHHDYIEHQVDRRCGPRVLTFFLYLSDVEEGGATNFPDLKIAVMPKAGKAVLWPSVLDSDPSKKEKRTDHEAQDVIRGVKFGANAWLHLYDYQAAQEMGCT